MEISIHPFFIFSSLFLRLWRFHNAVTFRTAAERTAGLIVSLEQELKKTGAVYGGDGKNGTPFIVIMKIDLRFLY